MTFDSITLNCHLPPLHLHVLLVKPVIIMITGPFLFTAKNRKCSYHMCDFFVPPCNPTLISCSVVLWKDLIDFFIIYFFHLITFCIWKDFWKDDFLLSTYFLVHYPLVGNKTLLCKGSKKLWCGCVTPSCLEESCFC